MKAINRTLQQMKINSGEMHSDLEQAERDEILYKFKTGQIDVLVATDIVARGIDIDDIAMVINFDVPHDPEDYVHRIGRTARAERDGVAITFVSDDEIYSFKQIEKFLDRDVEKVALPEGLGETPDYNAPRGKGKSDRNNRGRGRGKKPTTDKQATDSEKNHATTADANHRMPTTTSSSPLTPQPATLSRLLLTTPNSQTTRLPSMSKPTVRRSRATSATASHAADKRTEKQLASKITQTSRRQTRNRSRATKRKLVANKNSWRAEVRQRT